MNHTCPDRTMSLRRDSFRSWLNARHDATVGTASVEGGCPLACWISDQYRLPCQVSFTAYAVQRDTSTVDQYPLPGWAAAFVYCLDMTYTLTYVTGEQALILFDELGVAV